MASYNLETNDLIQTNLNMIQYHQRMINTFHWVFAPSAGPVDGPTTLDALNLALSADANWYYQKVRPKTVADVQFINLTSQKIKPSRWRAQTFVINQAGTNPDDPLPQNVAVSMERWPLEARRGVTGRVQAPGIAATDVDQGELTPVAATAWEAIAQALKYTIHVPFAGDFVPVLAHITATGFSINEVIGAGVKDEIRVMRRRTVGRGI